MFWEASTTWPSMRTLLIRNVGFEKIPLEHLLKNDVKVALILPVGMEASVDERQLIHFHFFV